MVSERCHIICFGNELHADDGFGPAVFEWLTRLPLAHGVRLMRADISGISALGCFDNCERALVVDAVHGYGPAGSLHRLNADAVAPEPAAIGHGAGVGQLLRLLQHSRDRLPAIEIIGVEIAHLEAFRPGLSDTVAQAVPRAVQLIIERAQA